MNKLLASTVASLALLGACAEEPGPYDEDGLDSAEGASCLPQQYSQAPITGFSYWEWKNGDFADCSVPSATYTVTPAQADALGMTTTAAPDVREKKALGLDGYYAALALANTIAAVDTSKAGLVAQMTWELQTYFYEWATDPNPVPFGLVAMNAPWPPPGWWQYLKGTGTLLIYSGKKWNVDLGVSKESVNYAPNTSVSQLTFGIRLNF